MKAKKLIMILMAIALTSPMALARNEQLPNMYTATTAAAVTTTTINSPTIQSLGQAAEKNSNKGSALASAGMAVAAVGVAVTCIPPQKPGCKMFVVALAATTIVKMMMSKSSAKSAETAPAVTTVDDPYGLASGTTTTTVPTTPSYTNDPDWKNAIATMDKLKKDGWKIDLNKGTVTDPSGKKFATSSINSADSMKAAGFSASDMKAFDNAMAKVPALAAEKMKAADGTSMFDDGPGGGGSKPSASSDGGMTPYGSLDGGTQDGPKLGVDRDPAQVAGMSKDFNGNPIGVSQDSLFKMIDRRYELHQKNGSFLSH